jgi:DNA polymerase elongation subunit (family B)
MGSRVSMGKFYTSVVRDGGDLLVREVVGDKRVKRKVRYKPYLFVLGENEAGSESPQWRTLDGRPAQRRDFGSMWDARKYLKEFEGVVGFEVHGCTDFVFPFMHDEYGHDPLGHDPSKVVVMGIDIETDSSRGYGDPALGDKAITAITARTSKGTRAFACVDYLPASDVVYRRSESEADMLADFLVYYREVEPDVLAGWNSDEYDVPYLVNRITRVLGSDYAKLLSPWGIIEPKEIEAFGKTKQLWRIAGVMQFDYMRAYKKFTHKPQESYKLDYIAEVELKEKKVDYSEYGSLNELFLRNPQKFMEYNVKDVDLIFRLEEKLGLIKMVLAVSYYCRINYEDAFGTVKMWETLVHNHLARKKICTPPRKRLPSANFDGGFVKEVQRGMHHWVVSEDVDSFYPNAMIALNISPETFAGPLTRRYSVDQILAGALDQHRDEIGDRSVSGSCHTFRKDVQGFLPELMEGMYALRLEHKAKMIELNKSKQKAKEEGRKDDERYYGDLAEASKMMQLALKYALNSGYGALSNQYFLYGDVRLSESVTLTCQVGIQWVARDINAWLDRITGVEKDRIVAIDTDSNYICFDDLVKKFIEDESDKGKVVDFLDEVCKKKLSKVIADSLASFEAYMGAYKSRIGMKRETIADKAIWTAKKKYVMNAWDVEGVRFKEPELKVTGLEIVKSSTPTAVRKELKEAVKVIVASDEPALQRFVKEFREKFETLPVEDIAFPRSVTALADYDDGQGWFKKGAQSHLRAAIVYNKWLRDAKLDSKYPLIAPGDKIKYVMLRSPNPTRQDAFGFPGFLPRELAMEQWVDRDEQFERAFLSPLRLVLDAVGWREEDVPDLSSFF